VRKSQVRTSTSIQTENKQNSRIIPVRPVQGARTGLANPQAQTGLLSGHQSGLRLKLSGRNPVSAVCELPYTVFLPYTEYTVFRHVFRPHTVYTAILVFRPHTVYRIFSRTSTLPSARRGCTSPPESCSILVSGVTRNG
jgi:hypothetical protein